MKVIWEMSIGYPDACHQGEVEIPDDVLSGLSDEERREAINKAIWDDAMQYVDVYQIKDEEE